MAFDVSVSGSSLSNFVVQPSNFLPGFTPENPGISAANLQAKYGYGTAGKPGNGWYWIRPTVEQPAIFTYCNFTTEGGGWTLWRSYSYQQRGTFVNLSANTRNAQYHSGFDIFEAPYDWKVSIPTLNSNRQFLFYISLTGNFDSVAANNYAVIAPSNTSQDFFIGSGTQVSIPCYGKTRGYSTYGSPYSGGYLSQWWYNTSGYEPHTDSSVSGIPGSASSEDNFGFFNVINNASFPVNSYSLKFVR